MGKTTKKKRALLPETASRTGNPAARGSASFDISAGLGALALVGAGLWIYWPALFGQFLWDDVETVAANPQLRTLHGLAQIWLVAPLPDWPLTSTLLWTGWHVWGSGPFGYHLCTLALHITSGFLLWRLLRRLGLSWGWLGGLLFVLHPLAVESVAWVSETKNTLSLVFYLLACDAWLDAEEQKSSGYWRSSLCYLAALWSKTSTVALPLVFLLYAWWKRGTVTRREILRVAPFIVLALVLGLVSIYFQSNKPQDAAIAMGSPYDRVVRAGAALFFYLGRFVMPAGFLPIYPRPAFDPPSLLEVLSLPSLVAVFAGLWTQRRTWGRHVLFGLGFFVLNLAPALGLVKMEFLTISWVSDHLAYIAMMGPIGLVVAGWESLCHRLALAPRRIAYGATLAVLALLAWESRQVASLFVNAQTLWVYTIEHNPTAVVAHNNLGKQFVSQRRLAEAMSEYEQALTLDPNYDQAHQNLGTLLLETGHVDEAETQYQLALKANPHYANAYNGLGVALMQSGSFTEALAQYDRALQIDPAFANAHHNKATTLVQLGRLPEAIAEEKLALASYPEFPEAHAGLGDVYAKLGRWTDASAEYIQALKVRPGDPRARNGLARVQAALGQGG